MVLEAWMGWGVDGLGNVDELWGVDELGGMELGVVNGRKMVDYRKSLCNIVKILFMYSLNLQILSSSIMKIL